MKLVSTVRHINVTKQIWCGGSPTNAKIPHMRVYKTKIAVVGSAVVKTV